MIAQGVRFNAEKKQVGNYYSTKIWSFKMKAPCCGQEIVIQTDPKNTLYVIISGAKEKTVTYDEVDAEAVLLPEKEGVLSSCLYCRKCSREVVPVTSFSKNIICSYNHNHMRIFLLAFLVLCGVHLSSYCVKPSSYAFRRLIFNYLMI